MEYNNGCKAKNWHPIGDLEILEASAITFRAKGLVIVSQWQICPAVGRAQISFVSGRHGKDAMHNEGVLVT